MMEKIHKIFTRAVGLVICTVILLSAGCGGRSSVSRFYVLNPVASSEMDTKDIPGFNQDVTIGIAPVSLPKYLRKSQMVTRTGSNELHLAEYDRWAGKIEEDISRVIAENLSILLATDRVVAHSAIDPAAYDYTVKMDIIRFEGRLGGDMELLARWSIFDMQGNTVYGIKASHIIEPAEGGSYADMVAAQSRALAVFSRELAAEIKKLTPM